MTEGRLGAAFTAEVFARLDAAALQGRSRKVAWVTLTAVAAGLVLALVLARTPSRTMPTGLASRTQETAGSVRGSREPVGRSPEGADSPAPRPDTTPAAPVTTAPLVPAGSRADVTGRAPDPRRVESLGLTPIQVERLDVDAMEGPGAIEVSVLDVPALEVSALTAIARVDVVPIGQD
jgi:hypothetical protein